MSDQYTEAEMGNAALHLLEVEAELNSAPQVISHSEMVAATKTFRLGVLQAERKILRELIDLYRLEKDLREKMAVLEDAKAVPAESAEQVIVNLTACPDKGIPEQPLLNKPAANQSLRDLIMSALADEPRDTVSIATQCGLETKPTYRVLTQLKRDGLVIRAGKNDADWQLARAGTS